MYTKLATLFCIIVNFSTLYAQFCQPTQPNIDVNTLPNIPDIFETRIEASFTSMGKNEEMTMLYNNQARRAELVRTDSNQRVRKLFFYDLNEYITIKDFSCFSQNITGSNEFFGVVYDSVTDTINMKPANELFRYKNSFGIEKLADDEKRGISVYHYRSCQTWTEINAEFYIDFYFRKKEFTPAVVFDENQKELPVTVAINGKINGADLAIEYNFFEFNTIMDRAPDLTSLPPALYCTGQNDKRRPRDIPDSFSMTQQFESFSFRNRVVKTLQTTYSFSSKLVRFDFNFPGTLSAVKLIQDFNSGVGYLIDKNFGNCSMYPLGSFNELDEIKFDTNSDNPVVAIKSPNEFFYLDDTYFYTGTRMHRGIKCDVYISNRTDFIAPDVEVQPSYWIFEILFGTLDSYFESSDQSEGNIPIAAIITANNFSRNYIIDYFDFDSSIRSGNVFDVSQCFQAKERKEFAIQFEYPAGLDETSFTTFLAKRFETELYVPILSALSNYRISPLRIIPPKVVPQRRNIVAYTGILNSPPAKYHFTMLENKTINLDTAPLKFPSLSADGCASICLNDSKYNNLNYGCLSFDVCPNPADPNSVLCSFYNFTYVTNPNIQFQGSSICTHYKKNVESLDGVGTEEVYRNLEKNILSKDFVVNFDDKNGNLIVQFKASDIYLSTLGATTESTGNIPFETSTFFKQFKLFKEDVDFVEELFLKNPSLQLRKRIGVSIEECARLCINEASFVCESFSYDQGHTECKWTSLSTSLSTMFENVDYVANSEKFIMYSKDPLYDYFEYPFKIATTTDYKEVKVDSASECAYICSTEKTIKCRSFNLCDLDNSKKCLLSESHIHSNDKNPQIVTTALCSHFSRNTISDYKIVPQTELGVKAELIYTNSSVRKCADTCYYEDSFFCRSFDFLSDNTCRLYKENIIDQYVAELGIKKNPDSNHYSRLFFMENGVVIDIQILKPSSNAAKYGAGTIAGVSVALIIAGIVVGGGIAFAYLKFVKKSGDVPTMGYVNQNYEK